MADARRQRDHKLRDQDVPNIELVATPEGQYGADSSRHSYESKRSAKAHDRGESMLEQVMGTGPDSEASISNHSTEGKPAWRRAVHKLVHVLKRYRKFVGPGFMISVAYIDPGNYATDVQAGATYRFKLLCMVLVSNIFAIYLQSLAIKLGSVTGLNLAEMAKAHCPPWLNYTLYFFAECAIIATDIAEVCGTAIAINLLSSGRIPLVAGCAISICDVLFILLFWDPRGKSMKMLRAFEVFVMLLVVGVTICFCFQLSLIEGASVGEVFRGYLPSRVLVQGRGLYQACGILGATVMPHSLYLGSGNVQARLKEFDRDHNMLRRPSTTSEDDASVNEEKYRPSIAAIRSCMSYSIAEVAISLFTFALFINSAILIVAGASLSHIAGADNADLFGVHALLSRSLAPAAGTIFALALLLSGLSAGIVCTIAGQMVSEGQLSLNVKPWVQRLLTRSISIVPSIIVAGAVGASGLNAALVGSQVALSVLLPILSAPLIYFTCRNKFMTVHTFDEGDLQVSSCVQQQGVGGQPNRHGIGMRNHWVTTAFAVLIWAIITLMDIATIVLLGLGVGG